jgi:RNA polymerase sigma-70 factor (ECF subfamily)
VTEREIKLIRLAQQGDTKAFGELVALHDTQVMNLAISLVGCKEDARDVYQEIFTKVYKSLKQYRFQSEFFTYLYRITVNTSISYRKNRSRKKAFFPMSVEDDPESSQNLPMENEEGVDSDMMQEELSDIVKAAIEELPPKQKAVVILRHYHSKKLREIANIMNLQEGTVKGYLFRALGTLKTKLGPYYYGEDRNEL